MAIHSRVEVLVLMNDENQDWKSPIVTEELLLPTIQKYLEYLSSIAWKGPNYLFVNDENAIDFWEMSRILKTASEETRNKILTIFGRCRPGAALYMDDELVLILADAISYFVFCTGSQNTFFTLMEIYAPDLKYHDDAILPNWFSQLIFCLKKTSPLLDFARRWISTWYRCARIDETLKVKNTPVEEMTPELKRILDVITYDHDRKIYSDLDISVIDSLPEIDCKVYRRRRHIVSGKQAVLIWKLSRLIPTLNNQNECLKVAKYLHDLDYENFDLVYNPVILDAFSWAYMHLRTKHIYFWPSKPHWFRSLLERDIYSRMGALIRAILHQESLTVKGSCGYVTPKEGYLSFVELHL